MAKPKRYPFASSPPIDSPSELWELQFFLLHQAEQRIGKKNPHKSILPPNFKNRGPYILNICDDAGNYNSAHAVLSYRAFNDWSVALYELAHETIHLLNPIIGSTNYLEEGIAVTFSNDMAKYHADYDKLPDHRHYLEAWELVQSLPNGPYACAKTFREHFSALSEATPNKLSKLLPNTDTHLITRLCEKFEST